MKPKTTAAAVADFQLVHGSTYYYFLVDYKKNSVGVDIGCPRCGRFFVQQPKHHQAGRGCPCRRIKPAGESLGDWRRVHGDRYYYWATDYKKTLEPVTIGCRKCGRFFDQKPFHHQLGHGCPACSGRGRNPLAPCTFYIIKQTHADAVSAWIKVGITRKADFKKRFRRADGIVSTEIRTWRLRYRRDARKIERAILETFREHRTPAPVPFYGRTECFPLSLRRQIVKESNRLADGFENL